MSLVGNLEDLGLGEILQIVSLSRRSGVLSLESRGREARIIFRSGQVIRASSSTFHQNLGEVLIQKGVIDLTTLKRALSIQADEGYSQLLGVIMIDRFGISADAIEAVVREQIENVVYSLFAWAEGTFEFELQEVAEGDATKLDPVQFMLQQGLNPQYLAMEGSRIIDEQRHRAESGGEEPAPADSDLDFAFHLVPDTPSPAAEKPSPHRLPPIDVPFPDSTHLAAVTGAAEAPAAAPAGAVCEFLASHAAAAATATAAEAGQAAEADQAAEAAQAAQAADPWSAALAATADSVTTGADAGSATAGTGTDRATAATGAASAAPAPSQAASAGRPLVLVDDDPATLNEIALLLEQKGYRVDAVAQSEDALIRVDNLYRDGIRPVVVVDLIMPRMDGTGILGGLELMELVRGNFPELPLLALSDFPNEEAQRKLRGMGIATVVKPVKGEIQDAIVSFAPKLLQALGSTAPDDRGPGLSQVNIGDELRLEMGEEPALPAPHLPQSVGISQLRGMLEELNNPQLGGGIILLALRFAAEFVNRAVVLLVKKECIQGLGQFGLADGDDSADSRVRNLRIPREEPSLFTPVLQTQFPLKGEPEHLEWNDYFLDQLGGDRPLEVFVGPIVSEGKVVAVLYGDNLPEHKPIGDTDSLEIFLSQAGIAMEKALLQRRLQEHARGVM